MPKFDLISYCKSNHFKPKAVRTWLMLNMLEVINDEMELDEHKIIQIKMLIDDGSKRNFAIKKINNVSKALGFIESLIHEYTIRINEIEEQIHKLKDNEIIDQFYQELIIKNQKRRSFIKIENILKHENELNLLTSELVEKTKKEEKKIRFDTAFIHWDEITFGENAIWFHLPAITYKRSKKRKANYFRKFSFPGSRISFNKIKEIYSERKIPPIEVHYINNTIIQIENEEVLFYFFKFFENLESEIKVDKNVQIHDQFQRFNKAFYQRCLSNFFSTRCFRFLIDIVDENLPIIPVPEKVKNSSGFITIHDSFMFPIKKDNRCLWIWESVEESKATYIFETSFLNFENELQVIYDYLTGEMNNKRLSLVQKKINAESVNIKDRISHSDFDNWKQKIVQNIN